MLAPVLLVITIATGLFYYFFKRHFQKSSLPPGPFSLPILGNFFSIDIRTMPTTYFKWAKQYGAIFKVDFGFGSPGAVVLNDPALIKEAYSQDVFVPRPSYWEMEQRSLENHGTNGILLAKGKLWKEHRRFILQTFRDFGVGKQGMEEKILEEANELVKTFQSYNEQPIDNKIPITTAVANVIANVLSGIRYEADDPVLLAFLGNVKELFNFTATKIIMSTFPVTRFFPPINKTYQSLLDTLHGIRSFLETICDEHLKNWDSERKQDFLDYYISAVKAGAHESFSYKELPLILEDLFEAGYETTATTLRWGFLMMCLNPEVQKKVQEELDANVPEGIIPKPSEKYNLPYVEATIQEINRYGSIVPLGVDHCAAEDTKLRSYDIPKGTWIQANLRYVHHNEEWWDKPEEFNPSRFLTPDGHVIEFSEYLIPFSVGKRRCLGEALAKAELFILFIAILQNFHLRLDADPATFDVEPVFVITADTKPHKIIYVPRKRML